VALGVAARLPLHPHPPLDDVLVAPDDDAYIALPLPLQPQLFDPPPAHFEQQA
jgi:hypothetical protein